LLSNVFEQIDSIVRLLETTLFNLVGCCVSFCDRNDRDRPMYLLLSLALHTTQIPDQDMDTRPFLLEQQLNRLSYHSSSFQLLRKVFPPPGHIPSRSPSTVLKIMDGTSDASYPAALPSHSLDLTQLSHVSDQGFRKSCTSCTCTSFPFALSPWPGSSCQVNQIRTTPCQSIYNAALNRRDRESAGVVIILRISPYPFSPYVDHH
jgi:hypothetical protein